MFKRLAPAPFASCSSGRLVCIAAVLCVMAFAVVSGALAQNGGFGDRPLFPKNPPPRESIRVLNIEGLSKTIPGVPEYIWWYGCSPTAGGMIIGWWDAQTGCGDLFEGSAATWYGTGTSGTKRMVASQAHIDAGKALGLTYGSYQNHTADCIADFFYTQNGGTSRSNIGPGFVNFAAWDDPTTATNETYQASYQTKYTSSGWTYEQFCAEIDAGRPVHLGLTSSAGGHSVTAVGYDNTDGKKNYICWTTWGGWGLRSWGWNGESESGYNFTVYAGTYLTITPKSISNNPPTAPTSVSVSPANPLTDDNLTASASGSTDGDGDSVSYEYQWARSTDGGKTWSSWGWNGATLDKGYTAKGEQWKAQARASDGKGGYSAWVASAVVTIGNTTPTTPTTATISPGSPLTTDALVGSASGSTDADGDTLTYQYQWASSSDGGKTWSSWGYDGATLADSNTAKGQQWKMQVRASDGTATSAWKESSAVTIGNSSPAAPTGVAISPTSPLVSDDLIAAASGSTDPDGDTITYEYQWAKSTDGGKTWSSWGYDGATLASSNTAKGEQWKVQARASDGSATSAWKESGVVVIGNTAPSMPTAVSISPANPLTADNLTGSASGGTDADGDSITYEYQWAKSTDGGKTWSAWGYDGATLAASNTTKGQQWKLQARSNDGSATSDWKESGVVTIGNTAPTAPSSVVISPSSPATDDDLVGSASGSTDADGDSITYEYQWAKSTDGGKTWSAWSYSGATLAASNTAKGEQWKVQARASDGSAYSVWVASAAVTVGNVAPTAPMSVAISPSSPLTTDALNASASGSTDADGDSISYEYEWAKSTDGGDTWSAWAYSGATLIADNTTKGEQWKARARASDGNALSPWTESGVVSIGNSTPSKPTALSIAPSSPLSADDLTATASGATDADSDSLSYEYEWAKSTDGGATWSAWGWSGSVLSAADTASGERWKARARASDGTAASDWLESAAVTIDSAAPTAPTAVTIKPSKPKAGQDLVASASGSSDADGDTVSYNYAWAVSTDGGVTWSAWNWTGAVLPGSNTAKNQRWKARAQASDGQHLSEWIESKPVTIGNTAPTPPTKVITSPKKPTTTEMLGALPTGATDPDGDLISYRFRWYLSNDGGATWIADRASRILPPGYVAKAQMWKVGARASDGEAVSDWTYSEPVVIANSKPSAPSQVTLKPAAPILGQNLEAIVEGGDDPDGDPITYQYAWFRSTDGGKTWRAGPTDQIVQGSMTRAGELWRVQVRASDGEEVGPWTRSNSEQILSNSGEMLAVTATALPARGGQVAVTVNLTAAAEVEAAVLNLAGRVVGVVPGQQFVAGVNTVWWNGRSTSGTLVPSGAYLVRVTARSKDGNCTACLVPLRK